MKHFVKNGLKSAMIIIALFAFVAEVSAQESNSEAYEKAKTEITQTFGTFPSWFEAYPQFALPGAWQAFKELSSGGGSIDAKTKDLIQLAVAAQIPCKYCVYLHLRSAKANGASDEEVKEAVAYGAEVRHWSMVIHGAEVDFEKFKKEIDEMMKFMSAQSSNQ